MLDAKVWYAVSTLIHPKGSILLRSKLCRPIIVLCACFLTEACHRFTYMFFLFFLRTDSPARLPARGGPCVWQHAGHSSHLGPADGRSHHSPSPEIPLCVGAPPDRPDKGAWLQCASDGPHTCRGIVVK